MDWTFIPPNEKLPEHASRGIIGSRQLLREYAEGGSEAGFREIVVRHTDVLYSAALRQVSSPDLARDVVQSVFTDLARNTQSLTRTPTGNSSLLGWLYRSTRFAALNQLRDDRRRQVRERQAMEYLEPASETATDWECVHPLLEEAMSDLSDEDREALLLRFFTNRDFHAVGESLGVSDDTAQKRVSRALEKLRAEFARRGVTTTAIALSTTLSAVRRLDTHQRRAALDWHFQATDSACNGHLDLLHLACSEKYVCDQNEKLICGFGCCPQRNW